MAKGKGCVMGFDRGESGVHNGRSLYQEYVRREFIVDSFQG